MAARGMLREAITRRIPIQPKRPEQNGAVSMPFRVQVTNGLHPIIKNSSEVRGVESEVRPCTLLRARSRQAGKPPENTGTSISTPGSMLLLAFATAAAPDAITPRCYLDPVYANDTIRLISNVTFGSSFNNKTGLQQTLQLDAYLPPVDDKRTKIPVIVVVHGESMRRTTHHALCTTRATRHAPRATHQASRTTHH